MFVRANNPLLRGDKYEPEKGQSEGGYRLVYSPPLEPCITEAEKLFYENYQLVFCTRSIKIAKRQLW